jgi:NAD(P)-dependent dehydrogenase (short-subunit alcohol dehydrogenase family)
MTEVNGAGHEHAGQRVAVVTGGNSGIGLAAAVELARRGWTVALVGRDEARLAEAEKQVRAVASAPVQALRSDFSVLAEVRTLAETLRSTYPRIDLLANNAGGVFQRRRTTVDGFEQTIQVNHLAGFLLSHELRDRLAGGRIVNTSSGAHSSGRLDPADLSATGRPYIPLLFYGSAKQANVLFAAQAARLWPEILSTSYHPGVVRTRFGNENPLFAFFYRFMPFLRTPAKGAETLVWLATEDASAITPGGYYMDRKLVRPSRHAADPELAERLWAASLAAVGL